MFDNDFNHKGLFTFYREQAQFEQKHAQQKIAQKSKGNCITLKENRKRKTNHFQLIKNQSFQNTCEFSLNQTQSPKKSFDEMNKALVRKISIRNQSSPQIKSKEVTSDVVVILKGNKTKQDLKLNKLNLSYQMQQGYFLKERIFDPLQQINICTDQSPQDEKNFEQAVKIKKTIKRNLSLYDRYGQSKSQLESQLILSKELNRHKQRVTSGYFEASKNGLKRVDLLSQLPDIDKSFTTGNYSTNHLVHKRVPPKVLASILKNENSELIKSLRKQIQKEREEQKKNSMAYRNHSFIEYGSFNYEKKELDLAKLNEKQRRMIIILNKFSKRG